MHALDKGDMAFVTNEIRTEKWQPATYALYIVDVVLLKISLGTFFLRIVQNSPAMRIIIYVILAIITIYGTVFLLLFKIGHCGIAVGSFETCSYQHEFILVSSVWSFLAGFTEFAFAVMAMTVIWNLQLPRSQKLITGALIAFGSIGGVAAIIRGYYTIVDSVNLNIPAQFKAGYCIALQMSIGITAACLATLKPLMVSFFHVVRGSSVARPGEYIYGRADRASSARPPIMSMDTTKDGIKVTNIFTTFPEEEEGQSEPGHISAA
ncbi:hypothetical protein ANO11243_075750 [Dothideomycetidae sp. 11243]|nr:hypothetical protein ANO11243_075750 [fungal sp. No.11243]